MAQALRNAIKSEALRFARAWAKRLPILGALRLHHLVIALVVFVFILVQVAIIVHESMLLAGLGLGWATATAAMAGVSLLVGLFRELPRFGRREVDFLASLPRSALGSVWLARLLWSLAGPLATGSLTVLAVTLALSLFYGRSPLPIVATAAAAFTSILVGVVLRHALEYSEHALVRFLGGRVTSMLPLSRQSFIIRSALSWSATLFTGLATGFILAPVIAGRLSDLNELLRDLWYRMQPMLASLSVLDRALSTNPAMLLYVPAALLVASIGGTVATSRLLMGLGQRFLAPRGPLVFQMTSLRRTRPFPEPGRFRSPLLAKDLRHVFRVPRSQSGLSVVFLGVFGVGLGTGALVAFQPLSDWWYLLGTAAITYLAVFFLSDAFIESTGLAAEGGRADLLRSLGLRVWELTKWKVLLHFILLLVPCALVGAFVLGYARSAYPWLPVTISLVAVAIPIAEALSSVGSEFTFGLHQDPVWRARRPLMRNLLSGAFLVVLLEAIGPAGLLAFQGTVQFPDWAPIGVGVVAILGVVVLWTLNASVAAKQD